MAWTLISQVQSSGEGESNKEALAGAWEGLKATLRIWEHNTDQKQGRQPTRNNPQNETQTKQVRLTSKPEKPQIRRKLHLTWKSGYLRDPDLIKLIQSLLGTKVAPLLWNSWNQAVPQRIDLEVLHQLENGTSLYIVFCTRKQSLSLWLGG